MPRALSTLLDESERLLLLVLSCPRRVSILVDEVTATALRFCCPVMRPLSVPRVLSMLEDDKERLVELVWFAANPASMVAEVVESVTEDV
jgi:hypothetical protein